MRRDLVVLRKDIVIFCLRTVIQPFLLVFVFLYVFPTIGQGVGSSGHGHAAAVAESAFATVLVPGVVAHIDHVPGPSGRGAASGAGVRLHPGDRRPCAGALSDLASGRRQDIVRVRAGPPLRPVRLPDRGRRARPGRRGAPELPLVDPRDPDPARVPGDVVARTAPRHSFQPRNIGLMFGFIVLPITFLGGTYYQWTKLSPVHIGGFHWLQVLVLVNPLIYVTEGMRAALTDSSHMHLYIVYPLLSSFFLVFLTFGLRNFRRRVLA